MKTKVLTFLKEAQGYVSGQALSEHLGVSRTAIWKVIRQLEEDGYYIKAVRNKGYCLIACEDMFTEAELKSTITTKIAGRALTFFEETDSTNVQAKKLAEQGAKDGMLVIAKRQTAGRGRRGRVWQSKEDGNIYMSLLLRPNIEPQRASMLTLVAALALRTGIWKATQVECLIKWPNDLVLEKKKLCGILTELSADMDEIHYVVVGIGINANMEQFPEEINHMATSLQLFVGSNINRVNLIHEILLAWEMYYDAFLKQGDLSLLMEEYNQYLVNCHDVVKVLAPAGEFCGTSKGINPKGELLVEKEDGTLVEVLSGEVSVRGIYGYV